MIDGFRRLRVPDALLWAFSRLLELSTAGRARLYRYRFVAQPVADRPHVASAGAHAITIRRIDVDDPIVRQFPRPRRVIEARFGMGATCIVAEKKGSFVGFVWLKEREYPEDEVRCLYRLDPRGAAAWDFDVHIEPAYRLGRTFARLWDSANAWLRERDYQWTISRISAFNPESLAAHRRLGMRTIGSAIFLCVSHLQLSLFDRAPFLHLGWREDQAPILRLLPPEGSCAATMARAPIPPTG